MTKWAQLLASLKLKHYDEASKELNVIQDYDDLQDALQVIPFKALNQDLPESLTILEKLYTKFISLTTNKEEGRLIIRHVFKVDALLRNVIRTQVRDAVLGRTEGDALDKDTVDQITQITWSMDCSIVKEMMSRLTLLKSTLKHFKKNLPTSSEVGPTSDEMKTDLKCCLAKFNSVVQYLETLTKGRTIKDTGEHSAGPPSSSSEVECGSCRDIIDRIRKRCTLNGMVLDVLEPCKGNIERAPALLQNLRGLVQSDMKFLEVMTELSLDISCYGDKRIEKVLEQYVLSYKSVLSAVATVSEPSSDSHRTIPKIETKTDGKDRNVVKHGLKIDVNGSPFQRHFDARRLHPRDQRERRERREPLRSHSCREPRPGEIIQVDDDSSGDAKTNLKLKEKLALKEKQLEETRSLVKNLKRREEQLLEKLTEQARNHLMNSEKFENISEDIPRVDHLVQQYDDLYSQLRLEALDDLDNIVSFDVLEGSDEIKPHITFAIITVSFHLAQQEIENRREKIYSLLNVSSKSLQSDDRLSLRNEISLQLRRSASSIDLQHIVEEALDGLCSTMFDFPELQSCEQLRRFVEACVQFSWSICAHLPPLILNYGATNFTALLHNKSHNSEKGSDKIKHHIWPALVESETKTVLYKGIVKT